MPMGEDRWLTVVSPQAPDEVELLLEPNRNPAANTYQKAIFEQGIPLTAFAVDDIQGEYQRLRKLGVAFRLGAPQRGARPRRGVRRHVRQPDPAVPGVVGPRRRLSLRDAVEQLREHHGPPEPPPTADPFELILWENVAYLAPPARRRGAFELLKRDVGTSPKAILSAGRPALEEVTSRGILEATFAAKLRECARIALDEFAGDLGAVVRLPVDRATRALRSFPGIGQPGAEKILLFSGRHALLAPDSNALRVLVRLGLVREGTSYARTYAAARQVGQDLSADRRLALEAHQLLQRHGQTLCKGKAPRCAACPLAPRCAHARATAREKGEVR